MASTIVACLTGRGQLGAAEHAQTILEFSPREIFRHVELNRADRAMQAAALERLDEARASLGWALEEIDRATRIYERALTRASSKVA